MIRSDSLEPCCRGLWYLLFRIPVGLIVIHWQSNERKTCTVVGKPLPLPIHTSRVTLIIARAPYQEVIATAGTRFTLTRVGTILTSCFTSPTSSVHPHARGDTRSGLCDSGAPGGSPPRAWGHCHLHAPHVGERRFTPTRVGTLPPSSCAGRSGPVHPHARGDTALARSLRAWAIGSPPRAWGHFHLMSQIERNWRFTPTRVGTLAAARTTRPRRAVHPHARGDTSISMSRLGPSYGSPPRAWGH